MDEEVTNRAIDDQHHIDDTIAGSMNMVNKEMFSQLSQNRLLEVTTVMIENNIWRVRLTTDAKKSSLSAPL